MKMFKKTQTVIRFNSMCIIETTQALSEAKELIDQGCTLVSVSGWGGDRGESRDWKFVGSTEVGHKGGR